MRELLKSKDLEGIRNALQQHPHLANEGIPYDDNNPVLAHPLHRICDGVFNNWYTDDEAVEMAKIFLEYGAKVDGNELVEQKDSPLTTAASLHAEKVALLYIDHGANIHHGGGHGGTALHWAAWVGRDKLVQRLIEEKAEINRRCIDFAGTPLLWALHGYQFGGGKSRLNQVQCARLLLAAGADKTIPNIEGHLPIEFVGEGETELMQLLQ